MARAPDPRWWQVRRAQNRKPATYRCPLCGGLLPALSEHMLLFPEGDHARRRHAHTACVLRARRAGRLPTREEWSRTQRSAGESGRTQRSAGGSDSPATPWGWVRERLRRRPR